MTRNCTHCGGPLDTMLGTLCSPKCKVERRVIMQRLAQKRRCARRTATKRDAIVRECNHCHKTYDAPLDVRGRPQLVCSPECRKARRLLRAEVGNAARYGKAQTLALRNTTRRCVATSTEPGERQPIECHACYDQPWRRAKPICEGCGRDHQDEPRPEPALSRCPITDFKAWY